MADAVSLDDRRVLGRTPVLKQCLKSPRLADLSLLAETNKKKAEALKDLGLRSDNLVEERRHIESAERVRNESVHMSSEQLTDFDRSAMSESEIESIHSESSHEPTTNWLNDLNWLNDFFVENEGSSEEALNSYDEIPGWSYADSDMKSDTDTDELFKRVERSKETVEEYCASLVASSCFPFLAGHLPDAPTLSHTLDLCLIVLQDLQESDENRCDAAWIIGELSDRYGIPPEFMDRMAAIRVTSDSFHNRCKMVSLWELYGRVPFDISTQDITQTTTSLLNAFAIDCAEAEDFRPGGDYWTLSSFWECVNAQNKRELFTLPMLESAARFVRHDDWSHTRAGLIVLGVLAEGCTVEVSSTIAEICLTALKHTHFAVRYEAVYVIESLLLPPRSILATTHLDNVFCGLLCGLADDDFYVKYGSDEVIEEKIFGEECGWNDMLPLLKMDKILLTIGETLEKKPTKQIFEDGHFDKMIKVALAAADQNREQVPDHYNNVIDELKTILDDNDGYPSPDNLCFNALLLVTRLATTTRNDSKILTGILVLVDSLIREDFWFYDYDRVVVALNDVWRRLSDDPFLPIILENPLYALTAKHRECDGEDDYDDPAYEYWPYEIKQIACEMLVMIVASFGESITPYATKISDTLMEYCQESTDIIGIRVASEAFPMLLKSVQSQGVAAMRVLWNDYYGWIVRGIREDAMTERSDGQAIESWKNAKTKSIAITALRECIEVLGKEGVSVEEINQIGRIILEQIEKEKNNLEITEPPRITVEKKKVVLDSLANLISRCLYTLGLPFYVAISTSLAHIYWMIGVCAKSEAIAVAATLIRNNAESAFAYEQQISRLLQITLSPSTPCSFAAWAVGVMAATQHEEWMGVGAQSLSKLSSMIGREGARSTEDDIWATENAIAAVAKILKFCGPEMIGLHRFNETLALFLTWLPVSVDEEEAVHTYGYLADAAEAKNAIVLGENGAMTGAVVHLLYQGIVSGVLDKTHDGMQLKMRLCDIISGLTTIRR